MTDGQVIFFLVVAIVAGLFGVSWFNSSRRLRRAEYIRTYRWPPGLLDKLSQDEVLQLNLATGVPLIYKMNRDGSVAGKSELVA